MPDADNIAAAKEDQNMLDRALVAIAYGWHKPGAGFRPYPLGDYSYRLARTGVINMEIADYGAQFLWMTAEGQEILADIEAEDGAIAAHMEAIRAACTMDRK